MFTFQVDAERRTPLVWCECVLARRPHFSLSSDHASKRDAEPRCFSLLSPLNPISPRLFFNERHLDVARQHALSYQSLVCCKLHVVTIYSSRFFFFFKQSKHGNERRTPSDPNVPVPLLWDQTSPTLQQQERRGFSLIFVLVCLDSREKDAVMWSIHPLRAELSKTQGPWCTSTIQSHLPLLSPHVFCLPL